MSDSVTFLASLPPIQSAVKVSGDGNGMRVQLEIPESEMGNAVGLLTMRGQVLEVTIKAVLQNKKDQDNGEASMAKGGKRQSRWKAPKE